MKQFLLFMGLVGAALYAFLVFTHNAITDGKSERIPVPQTQPNPPVPQRLSSWESHLPSRSQSQNSQPSAHLPAQQNVADELRRDPSQNWEQTNLSHQTLNQPTPTARHRLNGLG